MFRALLNTSALTLSMIGFSVLFSPQSVNAQSLEENKRDCGLYTCYEDSRSKALDDYYNSRGDQNIFSYDEAIEDTSAFEQDIIEAHSIIRQSPTGNKLLQSIEQSNIKFVEDSIKINDAVKTFTDEHTGEEITIIGTGLHGQYTSSRANDGEVTLGSSSTRRDDNGALKSRFINTFAEEVIHASLSINHGAHDLTPFLSLETNLKLTAFNEAMTKFYKFEIMREIDDATGSTILLDLASDSLSEMTNDEIGIYLNGIENSDDPSLDIEDRINSFVKNLFNSDGFDQAYLSRYAVSLSNNHDSQAEPQFEMNEEQFASLVNKINPAEGSNISSETIESAVRAFENLVSDNSADVTGDQSAKSDSTITPNNKNEFRR